MRLENDNLRQHITYLERQNSALQKKAATINDISRTEDQEFQFYTGGDSLRMLYLHHTFYIIGLLHHPHYFRSAKSHVFGHPHYSCSTSPSRQDQLSPTRSSCSCFSWNFVSIHHSKIWHTGFMWHLRQQGRHSIHGFSICHNWQKDLWRSLHKKLQEVGWPTRIMGSFRGCGAL